MRYLRCATAAAALFLLAAQASAARLQSPEQWLGFKPGADQRLAGWEPIEKYFRRAGELSDRVRIEELGLSTENRRMIAAVISALTNLKQLDRLRLLQRQIADPRLAEGDAARREAIAHSKVVVLVSCSLHSSECVATHTALELLYELATSSSAEIGEILEQSIVLLVPSANPDGTDLVANWYRRTLGKPWEGDGLPWLYHKYCGHDNNRDWFALNLAETRNLSRLLYQQWFPTIVLDLHQQSSNSVRIALPPYHNPVSPNIPPLVSQAQLVLGGHMALALSSAGKTGVAYNVNYDLWYHGAFRSTPNRHNMIGILTESASTRLATPIFIPKRDLKPASRGLPQYAPAVNFSEPWPGGWWRPGDILEYQRISTLALLSAAARHRATFQANHRQMAEQAVALGHDEPPRAWLVPSDQADRGSAVCMLRSLQGTGIEIRQAEKPFVADGVTYPAGTWQIPCDQPYRPHLMDMLQRQKYPDRPGPDGKPEPPYDIAGWTLPLQMGVRCVAVAEAITGPARKLDSIPDPEPRLRGPKSPAAYLVPPKTNDDYRLLHRLARQKIELMVLVRPVRSVAASAGSFLFVRDQRLAADEKTLFAGLGIEVRGLTAEEMAVAKAAARPLAPARLAVYQPWLPSMDEGWTRLALEQFEFPYTSLHNVPLRAGRLRERFDCIVLPSISVTHLLDGQSADATEPQYTGGIGEEGVARLREFVAEGGSLVCIDDACAMPIKYFGIPVYDALRGSKNGRAMDREQFFCPGSILAVDLTAGHALNWGRPERVSAYFVDSRAFEVESGGKDKAEGNSTPHRSATVVARYAPTLLLESGYLRGPEFLAGKPAVVEVSYGRGRIVLFGFRVQHRCHTHGTFRLLFNAIAESTLELP